MVRSRINSPSNSASAAKMPNTNRPAAVVVSSCIPLAGVHPQTHAPHGQVRNGIDEMDEVAPEPVELPHHEQKVFAFVGRNVVSLPVDYW